MTKYGWRNNKISAEEISAEVTDFSSAATVGTAATGTAIYIPVVVGGNTYYIEGKL